MTDFEREILNKLDELTRTVAALKAENSISRLIYFENLSPAAVVGADYVSFRLNVPESAVLRGRFRTNEIKRFRQKPLAWIKRDVDSFFQMINESTSEKAAKLRQNTKKQIRRKKEKL
jgi:hypothetical protein